MNQSCNRCGNVLLAGSAGQRCPKCLLELALETGLEEDGPLPPATLTPSRRFGDYELVQEISRGGMGVVFKAKQTRLNRIVALKLILSGQFASKQEVLRFRAEAEAAANLRHPNIVAIHETGEANGQHFFSMEFVEGRDLATIARDGPLPANRAARYAGEIARAIHYAHQQGTLHRDLKPSNVLIDANDQVRITDFGLAKRLRGDFGLTVTGQVLGSPNFMPPEQTSGQSLAFSPAGDVYGIGAILYHLLTGRPPFQAGTIEEVLRQLHEQEPVPPRLLLPDLSRDLETICLKCLEKDPAKRYSSAEELAEELGRFLRDEPIRARPTGRIEKVWRWCRRKPFVASLLTALGLAVLLGTGGVLWAWQSAATSATALRRGLYAADINLAGHVRTEKDINRAANLLRRHVPKSGETDLRGFEWRYLWALCQGRESYSVLAHDAEVTSVAVTPDGQFFLTTGNDRTAKLWNLKTRELQTTLKQLAGKPSLHSLAVSADGRRVAACDPVSVTVWGTTNWAELKTLNEPAMAIAFSPGNGALATSSGDGIKLWHPDSWIPQTLIEGPLELFAFSPDGRSVAVARGEKLELHNATTGELMLTLPGNLQDHAYALTFSPDGKLLAVGGMYGEVKVWNVSSQELVAKITQHTSFVSGLTFSPDGQWLATGGIDQYLTLNKVVDWHQEAELFGHTNGIWSMTFTPDSHYLVSASRDHTVKFWKVPPEPKVDLLGDAQTLIGFLPDSRTAVTLNADATLGFWDVASLKETNRKTINSPAPATVGALSADGLMVALGFMDGAVAVRHLATGLGWHRASGGTNAIFSLVFAPDGQSLVSTDVSLKGVPTINGKLVVWDVASGEPLATLTESLGRAGGAVAFSHHAQVLAVGRPDNSILLWDRLRQRQVHMLKGHQWNIASLAFSPDDRTLASASWDTSVRLWDVATGKENARLPGLPVAAGAVCFSPDGRTLAATFGNNTIQLWQVWDLHELLSFQWSGRFIGPLYFSPDGTTLGAGRLLPISPDGQAQLWRAPVFKERQ